MSTIFRYKLRASHSYKIWSEEVEVLAENYEEAIKKGLLAIPSPGGERYGDSWGWSILSCIEELSPTPDKSLEEKANYVGELYGIKVKTDPRIPKDVMYFKKPAPLGSVDHKDEKPKYVRCTECVECRKTLVPPQDTWGVGETVEHLVTVIGINWERSCDEELSEKERKEAYKEACKYTREYIDDVLHKEREEAYRKGYYDGHKKSLDIFMLSQVKKEET